MRSYDKGAAFCELTDGVARHPKPLHELWARLAAIDPAELTRRAKAAERELLNLGITFTVYSESDAIDRALPFDVTPRPIASEEWAMIARGVTQRVKVLNTFLQDIYGPAKILKDGVVPRGAVESHPAYRAVMREIRPKGGVFVHVAGIDLVRDADSRWLVLEDNARSPSGVSYVLENRALMLRAFPDLVSGLSIAPVSDYGRRFARKLAALAPDGVEQPTIALLTPGVYNSAYFEHVFLARELGAALAEGRDLYVDDDKVFLKTVRGPQRVHVIYRRIDDDFLDPETFREDSMLGVRGLMRAYAKGNVTIANAVGAGVADDKAIYSYIPEITRYYLGEDPVLANVPTFRCAIPSECNHVLAHIDQLVVKPVGGSGGYGVVIGPRATQEELETCRAAVEADPANFIAQPMITLSVCPTLIDGALEPRHVDLRPFAVTGPDTWVLPGGLTRVALKKGSLVVNSSQGGGSKDTWVLG